MKYIVVLMLFCTCLAAQLSAGLEGIIEGVATDEQGRAANAKSEATVDPEWGVLPDASEEVKRRYREERAVVSGSAETTSNRDGTFLIKVPVTVSDEAKLPQSDIPDENRKYSRRPYVVVKFTVTQPGFRPTILLLQVPVDGSKTILTPHMVMERTYEARLVDVGGKPIAGARVGLPAVQRLVGDSVPGDSPPAQRVGTVIRQLHSSSPQREFVSDKQGRIHIPDIGLRSFNLRFLDVGWSFPLGHAAWSGIELKGGKNDGGTITVMPGGGLKLRAVVTEAASPSPVLADVRLLSKDAVRPLGLTATTSDKGEMLFTGLPVTTYEVTVEPRWSPDRPPAMPARYDGIAVQPGKTTDMGDVRLEPFYSVEFKAVDEGGGSIQQFRVRMVPDLDSLPPNIALPAGRHEGYAVSSEDRIVRGLLRGNWRAEIHCPGCQPVFVQVTVPRESPVIVKIERGGAVEVSSLGGRELEDLILVSTTAPCFDTVKAMPAAQVQIAFKAGLDPAKVYSQPQNRSREGKFEGLPAGEYILFARWRSNRYARADGIAVRVGETTSVKVDLKARAEFRVRVTDKGQPKPGVALVAVVKGLQAGPNWEDQGPEERVTEVSATSDASGMANFGSPALGEYQVLTRREHDWRKSDRATGPFSTSDMGVPVDENQIQLSPGDRIVYALELFHPGRTWLTVEVKGPESIPIEAATISPPHVLPVFSGRTVKNVNGTLVFGPVRLGAYDFFDSVGMQASRFHRQITVNQPLEQTIRLEFAACKLQVKIVRPPALKNIQLTAYLRSVVEHDEELGFTPSIGEVKPAADGNLEIHNVPTGSYYVTVWALREHNGPLSRGAIVHVPRDKTVTVNFSSPQGAVRFMVTVGDEDRSLDSGFDSYGLRVWAEFRAGGKIVPVQGYNATLVSKHAYAESVPVGVYDVRLYGRGVETQVVKGVKITADNETEIKARLTPTKRVHLNIENIQDGALHSAAVKCEALDAGGKPIPVDTAGCQTVFHPPFAAGAWDSTRTRRLAGCQLMFTNVPPQCVRLRVTVEGFQPVEFDLRPEHSAGQSPRTNLVPR